MPSLRELRRKVKSVKSTQQITKSMKLVAAARLTKAQGRILSARPFAEKLEHLLQELAYLHQMSEVVIPAKAGIQALNVPMKNAENLDPGFRRNDDARLAHPFFEKRESGRIDVVLVTADRGLCGAFNASLIREALRFRREHAQDDIHLWTAGKKGRDFFRRYGVPIEKEYVNVFQRLGFAQAEVLGKDLSSAFLKTGTREIVFIYNEFKSRLQQRLMVRRLLPIEPFEGVKPRQDFIYEPSREAIMDKLLPRYFNGQVYRILLESQAAELAARMTAMEAATDNANDLIYSLTLTMNKVRQASITKEISEIVGGAEALQN